MQSPTLQPYLTYPQDRWQVGCHNVAQLFRELVGCGYPGSRSLLQPALDAWRPRARPTGVTWLVAAKGSGLAPFIALANGINADHAAVEAALTTEGANGPVEGHVNQIKLLKRSGYGRMKRDLLRSRVLAAEASPPRPRALRGTRSPPRYLRENPN